jgi:hypothetical protein
MTILPGHYPKICMRTIAATLIFHALHLKVCSLLLYHSNLSYDSVLIFYFPHLRHSNVYIQYHMEVYTGIRIQWLVATFTMLRDDDKKLSKRMSQNSVVVMRSILHCLKCIYCTQCKIKQLIQQLDSISI